jgi:hypothetical protein
MFSIFYSGASTRVRATLSVCLEVYLPCPNLAGFWPVVGSDPVAIDNTLIYNRLHDYDPEHEVAYPRI